MEIIKYNYPLDVFENGDVYRCEHYQYYGNKKYFFPRKKMDALDNGNGYKCVKICKNRVKKTLYIHRLVAEAFIPNTENKAEVNHIDGNRANNNLSNLEWMTRLENVRDYISKGRGREAPKKTVLCFDKTATLIKEYSCVNKAAIEFNVTGENIRSCCNSKTKTAAGLFWIYKERYNSSIHTTDFILSKFEKSVQKPVYQYDLDLNLINEYVSLSEASRTIEGVKFKTVLAKLSGCCLGGRKTAYKYIWSYEKKH
jgi:hypothetical protein